MLRHFHRLPLILRTQAGFWGVVLKNWYRNGPPYSGPKSGGGMRRFEAAS